MQRNCMVKIFRGPIIYIIVLSCVVKVFEKTLVFLVFMLKCKLHINENIHDQNQSPLNYT